MPSKTEKKGTAMSFDLTHARHDPAHCLAPGLFRSLKKGERKNGKLDVSYQFGDDNIRFWGPEPLGADDLRVLQGLVAMAAVSGPKGRGILLKPDPESEAGQQLRLFLDLEFEAAEEDAMVVKGSFRHLAKELGYEIRGGGAFKSIRESIERLYAVSIILQRGGKRLGYRILSRCASDEDTGKLLVALNPRLAAAIIGKKHTRIEMREVRALATDPARLIHQRLCGWIDPGKRSREIKIDTLCGYIWPDAPYQKTPGEKKTTLQRQHHLKARKALAELEGVGWTVVEYAKGKFEIGRPPAG